MLIICFTYGENLLVAILGKFPAIQIGIASDLVVTSFKVLNIYFFQWVEKIMLLSITMSRALVNILKRSDVGQLCHDKVF